MIFWFHGVLNAKAAKHAKTKGLLSGLRGLCVPCLWLLHLCADQVPPLGPRAAVVLHLVEAEQVLHREPRQARALADAAVGDHRLVAGNPFLRVERPQLVEALERAVVVAVLAP